MTGRTFETRMSDPTETTFEIAPNFEPVGDMPDDVPDFDAVIVHAPNGNGQHAIANQRLAATPAEIERALTFLFEPGSVVEIRALNVASGNYTFTLSGYFDDFHKAAIESAKITTAEGVYFTANQCDPSLLARRCNRIARVGKDPTTADEDILRMRLLLIDVDPQRATKISSTDTEHAAAIRMAETITIWFDERGWPLPVVIDSGNGAQVWYRIDEPTNNEGLIERCLKALAVTFDDQYTHIDQTMFNPSRITKLPGTWARKGDSTPDRPHRQARILSAPDVLEIVPTTKLHELAALLPTSNTTPNTHSKGTSNGKPFDLDSFIRDHALDVTGPVDWNGARKWNFTACPWNPAHTDHSAILLQFANGAIDAKCSHNSCSGKSWADLREIYEPGYRDRKAAKHQAKPGKPRTPTDDELAQRWLNAYPLTAYGLGDWRRYALGVWPGWSEDTINREIREVLIAAKSEGVRPSRYALSSVAEMARLTVSIPSEQWDADPDILVCRNGTLKISTRELLPHDPAYHVTESLPFDYDPSADAPTLRYVLDSTIPEAANLVQEFAGYCLTPDTSLETALWFHGIPGGGRSTIIGGFEAMLGKRAGVLGLAAVERSQFALTNLPGKTLVTSTEQPNLYIRSSHILNAIISGEPLIVEKKFESPYQITPRAKILWALNDLPRISEANSGLFRRVKVVSFPPRDEAQRDPAIKERVKQEGGGILNWALDGLERLRQRGYFEIPPCVQEATAEFKATNDIPQMFVDEMCLTGPDYKVQGSILYTAYRNWCIDTGHKPQSSTSLAEDWKRLGFERYRAAGKTFWRGIGLVSDETTK